MWLVRKQLGLSFSFSFSFSPFFPPSETYICSRLYPQKYNAKANSMPNYYLCRANELWLSYCKKIFFNSDYKKPLFCKLHSSFWWHFTINKFSFINFLKMNKKFDAEWWKTLLLLCSNEAPPGLLLFHTDRTRSKKCFSSPNAKNEISDTVLRKSAKYCNTIRGLMRYKSTHLFTYLHNIYI